MDHGFFRTLATRVVKGRTFTEGEFESAQEVAVLSGEAARVLFGDEDPLGREIMAGISFDDETRPFRVVGVVEDVLYSAPTEGMMPEMYLPLGLWPPVSLALFVRTGGDPMDIVPLARQVLESLDPDIPFWQVTTGRELRAQDVADTRILTFLLWTFAGLALLLSAAGLWAVAAQVGAERRSEIGLRMALGASRSEMEVMVVREAVPAMAGGGLLGLGIAALGAPVVSGVLFGVGPRNPLVFGSVALVLVGVGVVATWIPARSAARVNPTEALTSE